MSWISFLAGLLLIVIGAALAIFYKVRDNTDTIIDVFGVKISSRRAGYIFMIVGLAIMLFGSRLPSHLFPSREVKDFKEYGSKAVFGCEEEGLSEVTFNAPAGYKIINATPSTENLSYVKSGQPAISSQSTHSVSAKVVFAGKDRELGNCPGGGSGQVVVSGQIQEE